MTLTRVAVLCTISAAFAAVAGVYGGIYLDRRSGDAWGVNMHADEMATHLGVMSALSVLLDKNDTCGARKLLHVTIVSSKNIIQSARNIPTLENLTVVRMDKALASAAKATEASSSTTAASQCD